MPLVKIGQETGLLRMPAKALLGERARRWTVKREHASQKAEVVTRCAERHRHNRQIEMAANGAGNVTYRDSLIAHGV